MLREGCGALVVGRRKLGAGRWGRALRSGVERVQGTCKWGKDEKVEPWEPWLGRASLGLEVLVWEETVPGEGVKDVGIGPHGQVRALRWVWK